MQPYSVLMSVYHREHPNYLQQSLESIWSQTAPSDDIVLVCDGPLTDGLYRVIEQMKQAIGPALQVVPLEKNVGLGRALNAGIKHCRHSLVARMDTDDIAFVNRCEKQLTVLDKYPNVSIIGAAVAEFDQSPKDSKTVRMPPETHEDILRYARKRNPFNHPCIMFRKQAVEDAGGYQDFYLLEDYYLWIRMLQNGAIGYNLQEPLLWMRIGNNMIQRRGGWKYAVSFVRLYNYMLKSGFIRLPQYLLMIFIRVTTALMLGKARKFLYLKVLRKKNTNNTAVLRKG